MATSHSQECAPKLWDSLEQSFPDSEPDAVLGCCNILVTGHHLFHTEARSVEQLGQCHMVEVEDMLRSFVEAAERVPNERWKAEGIGC